MIAAPEPGPPGRGGWPGRHWLVAVLFAAAILYALVGEHRAHLVGAVPWLILLACPLLHVFMHHGRRTGHGGHAAHDDHAERPRANGGGGR